MEKPEYVFTEDDKARIIPALRVLAVAQAQFWDVLFAIELEHKGTEIETDVYLTGELASNCEVPPSCGDLDDRDVWDSFLEHARTAVRQ